MSEDDLRAIAGTHPERTLGRYIFVSERSDSTNSDARRAVEEARGAQVHGLVFTTVHQTAGRGTRGRGWWAPRDSSLALSFVLAPSPPLPYPAAVTLVTALSLHDASTELGAKVQIRWPNDLVDLEGRKIAGILAEAVSCSDPGGSDRGFVVGIGVNVRRTNEAPPAFLDQTISNLESSASNSPNSGPAATWGRAALVLRLLHCLESRFSRLATDGLASVVADFNARSYLAGRRVVLRHGARRIEGVFLGMNSRFEVEISPRGGTPIALPAQQLELIEHRNLD